MRAFRIGIGIAAVLATMALPSAALARAVVPPGNSAANQYTETAPSAGGEELPPGGHGQTPVKALGAKTAERIEALGPAGRATAVLAASGVPLQGGGKAQAGRRSGPGSRSDQGQGESQGGETVSGGSSGLGQVLSEATGASGGGQSGLLLVAVVGTGIWSIAYVWRRRGRAA